MFDAATTIWLDRKEQNLFNIIRAGDVPFLGLYAEQFGESERKFLAGKIRHNPNAVQWYLLGLRRWPAVFATYLTLQVVEGYGQRGNREVYPYVEKAVTAGLRHLTPSDRELCWQAYRKACLQLGLTVVPRHASSHYMTDEYLHQTGVPLRYVSDLTHRMLHYAERLGLPEDDDPAAIGLWSREFSNQLGSGLSRTVYQALGADDTDFYIRLFLRCLHRDTAIGGEASAIERSMDQAIRDSGDQEQRVRRRRLTMPRIVWQDGVLGVELPAGDDVSWRLAVDGDEQQYQGLLESRFVPLEADLPAVVAIGRNGEQVMRHVLWEDERNNRLLIFAANGTLVASGALGRQEPLVLPPGRYQLMLRFIPHGLEDELEVLQDDPSLYAWELELTPDSRHSLQRGPAQLILAAEARPLLAWRGNGVRDLNGQEFYPSGGLGLRVMIPEEWAAQQEHFILRLDPGMLGQTVEVVVPAGRGVDACLDLNEYCRAWQAGAGRLLAELRPGSTGRAIARAAIVLWNGLEAVEERVRFICSRLPEQECFDPELSDNARLDRQRSLLTYEDDTRRLFRLVFQTGPGRQLTFTGTVPGVFLTLRDYREERVAERTLRKGSVLAVDLYSHSVLEIRSTASGRLTGPVERTFDAGRSASVRLPLAGLVDHLKSGGNTLFFQADGSAVAEPLLKLVVPHQTLKFSGSRNLMGRRYPVHLETAAPLEALRLRAHDLLSGERLERVLHMGDALDGEGREGGVILCRQSDTDPRHRYNLSLSAGDWPDGAWLVELDGRIANRWGNLCDDHQEPRRIGLLCRNGKLLGDPADLLGALGEVGQGRRLALFAETHRALLPCRARRAWQFLPWVERLWEQLAAGLDSREPQTLKLLLELATLEAENVSEGQGPLLSITARFTWVFTRPGHAYDDLNRGSGTLLDCLRVMAFRNRSLAGLFAEGQFGVGAIFGFRNARDICTRGAEPGGFDLERYRQVLLSRDLAENRRYLYQEDWRPGWGQYLGALHYRYALRRLAERYQDCQTAREPHLGGALLLARRLHSCRVADLGPGWPPHLGDGPRHLGRLSVPSADDITQEEENLERLIGLLSLVAQVCRWEARDPGTLLRFRSLLDSYFDNPRDAEQALGCLLYLGEDLLAFYLLLWELVIVAEKQELLERTVNG